ncbi:mitochondrial carrier domain-containing protein [Tribonema minus]|uniref:Mitochondrial carrier domain-containing protein n=1 Tax=Tribonema minus TaxID=303371 RepID=A0A835YUL3_9STRA|nr:mitochondrial carrier domain-containing protein [Tribonema minus]
MQTGGKQRRAKRRAERKTELPPAVAEQKQAGFTAVAVALVAALALGDACVQLAHSQAPLVQAVGDKLAAAAASSHFSVKESLLAGAGAGLTRAVSRLVTFPLDTVKTRLQVSRLSEEQLARLPPGVQENVLNPSSSKGLFSGFGPFLLQAGPSNAAFFLTFDALNVLGAALAPGMDPNLTHLAASCLATVPSNLIRIPSEVIKQRLQVGQVSGNALDALRAILSTDGIAGLFVGGTSQLSREIPFNAIQFVAYDALKHALAVAAAAAAGAAGGGGGGDAHLMVDALLGALAAGAASLGTQPMDTTKTRIMTRTVPGQHSGGGGGVIESAIAVAKAEGIASLYLGALPRLLLVSTGGAFYFLGQELVRALMP